MPSKKKKPAKQMTGEKSGDGGHRKHKTSGSLTTKGRLAGLRKALKKFITSKDEVYTFSMRKLAVDRAYLHRMCLKMGLLSRSSGLGNSRSLSVYKFKEKHKNMNENKKSATCLTLSEKSKDVLQDLFNFYPPGDGELSEGALRNSNGAAGKRKRSLDPSFRKPILSKAEIAKKVELLNQGMNEAPELRKMSENRAKLPIASFKSVITSTLETHQVVLISGETGCGKTTQVPQYILDYMWGTGESCKIVCTQPRRISAISVAERISSERGETVGDTVGYKIRGESKGGRQSSIIFCTNGVLLRLLIDRGIDPAKGKQSSGNSLECIMGISHIIVDEIHERDSFSDLMIAILRDLLPAYPHVRLILMSATLDAERFSEYFGGCPIIKVPGFTYPVRSFYLEDVLSILRNDNLLNHSDLSTLEGDTLLTEDCKTALDESIDLALLSDEFEPLLELLSSKQTPEVFNYQHSFSGVSPLMVFARKGRVGDVCMLLSFGADCGLTAKDGTSPLDWAEKGSQQQVYEIIKKHINKYSFRTTSEELLEEYLSSVNPELIDIVLIEQLLRKICSSSQEGAILVFLPGWDDINRTKERLLASPFFNNPSKFTVFSLHSMIPSAEQKKVFERPHTGIRKIILSTNIAETSVTIDDVVYVIDSGRMKEKSYDPYSNVSTLLSSWVSKASAKQRAGRAGRCQPGICYHLYSKTLAESFLDYQVPEIKRVPMADLCLQVKLLDPNCRISEFLLKILDPPVYETLHNAIILLQNIGALTQDERLTELGEKLGALPVHPSTSKMLLFAILMKCLEPALTLACAGDCRGPFILPMDIGEKRKADVAKAELASLYGGFSDQFAVIAAFECWKRAKHRGEASKFCSKYYVSATSMKMLSHLRKKLLAELVSIGFIGNNRSDFSLNAQDPGILRALVAAGGYPKVAKVLPRNKYNGVAFVETASGDKVRLHPSSCNFNVSFARSIDSQVLIYDEVTLGDGGLYTKNCSLVGPYPLLLLATELAVAPFDGKNQNSCEEAKMEKVTQPVPDEEHDSCEEGKLEKVTQPVPKGEQVMSSPDNKVTVVVDRWLEFPSLALDVAQFCCLRERLSAAMLFKVQSPEIVLPPALEASMNAIACILSYDGLAAVQRRGFIAPSDFLRSLMSENTDVTSPHLDNVRGSMPYERIYAIHGGDRGFVGVGGGGGSGGAPMESFQSFSGPVGSGSGGGAPTKESFKSSIGGGGGAGSAGASLNESFENLSGGGGGGGAHMNESFKICTCGVAGAGGDQAPINGPLGSLLGGACGNSSGAFTSEPLVNLPGGDESGGGGSSGAPTSESLKILPGGDVSGGGGSGSASSKKSLKKRQRRAKGSKSGGDRCGISGGTPSKDLLQNLPGGGGGCSDGGVSRDESFSSVGGGVSGQATMNESFGSIPGSCGGGAPIDHSLESLPGDDGGGGGRATIGEPFKSLAGGNSGGAPTSESLRSLLSDDVGGSGAASTNQSFRSLPGGDIGWASTNKVFQSPSVGAGGNSGGNPTSEPSKSVSGGDGGVSTKSSSKKRRRRSKGSNRGGDNDGTPGDESFKRSRCSEG